MSDTAKQIDPSKDPWQILTAERDALRTRVVTAVDLLKRSRSEDAVCICRLHLGGCFPCEVAVFIAHALDPVTAPRKEPESRPAKSILRPSPGEGVRRDS